MKNLYLLFRILVLNPLLFGSFISYAQTDPPENLYVTPVGMASWDSISSNDFQFYKVFLNGAFIADTDSIAYQYGSNGEELIAGETYLAEVSALYNDGLSENVGFEFVYLPCDSFPPHSNFNGYEENNDLYFTWSPVEEDLVDIYLGTNFYFNYEFNTFVPATDTSFIFPNPGPGFYDYCFNRVYSYDDGEHSWESCGGLACLFDVGYPPEFDPPRNLDVVDNTWFQNPTICWLEWDEPNGFDPLWLQYDDGVNVTGLGVQLQFSYAVKWDPNQLEGFDGTQISKINFFPKEPGSSFTLKIWKGEDASIVIYEEELMNLTFDAWNEIDINPSVSIDPTEQLWLGFDVISSGYPAGCGNYMGNPNSDLISFDGINWEHLSDYGQPYSWNLAAYVEGSNDLSKIKSNDLLGYIVYRGEEPITDTIQELSFVDIIPEYSYPACYEVLAVYEMGISDPSNMACATIMPGIHSYNETSFTIYPNPTHKSCKIESTTPISYIKVYNQLGQLCLNFENIDTPSFQIDISQLESGIYFIDIKNGSKVQKSKLIIQ